MKRMSKRGTDKVLSLYWFVLLTIIAGGIFAMVYVFYGAPYDVRGIESGLFAEKIADCISKKGVIDSDFFSGKDFNRNINETFMKKCSITFNVEDGYGDEPDPQYLYIVEFYKSADLINIKYTNQPVKPAFYFYRGNLNFYVGNVNDPNYAGSHCLQEGDKTYTRLEECNERRLYSTGEDGEQYLIKILSVIIKSQKNVRQ